MRPLIIGMTGEKGRRGSAIAAGCLLVALAILVVAMQGVARASVWMMPVLLRSATVMLIVLPVLLIAVIPRGSRSTAANALRALALVLGVVVWLYALLFTLDAWGWIAVIVGVALFGVGLIPIAILAALVTGEWIALFHVVAGLILAAGARLTARAARASLIPRASNGEIRAEYEIHD